MFKFSEFVWCDYFLQQMPTISMSGHSEERTYQFLPSFSWLHFGDTSAEFLLGAFANTRVGIVCYFAIIFSAFCQECVVSKVVKSAQHWSDSLSWLYAQSEFIKKRNEIITQQPQLFGRSSAYHNVIAISVVVIANLLAVDSTFSDTGPRSDDISPADTSYDRCRWGGG